MLLLRAALTNGPPPPPRIGREGLQLPDDGRDAEPGLERGTPKLMPALSAGPPGVMSPNKSVRPSATLSETVPEPRFADIHNPSNSRLSSRVARGMEQMKQVEQNTHT